MRMSMFKNAFLPSYMAGCSVFVTGVILALVFDEWLGVIDFGKDILLWSMVLGVLTFLFFVINLRKTVKENNFAIDNAELNNVLKGLSPEHRKLIKDFTRG